MCFGGSAVRERVRAFGLRANVKRRLFPLGAALFGERGNVAAGMSEHGRNVVDESAHSRRMVVCGNDFQLGREFFDYFSRGVELGIGAFIERDAGAIEQFFRKDVF